MLGNEGIKSPVSEKRKPPHLFLLLLCLILLPPLHREQVWIIDGENDCGPAGLHNIDRKDIRYE